MNEFNEYFDEFKKDSLENKKKVALDQLKLIAALTNEMCKELNVDNEVIVNKDIIEATDDCSEEDFVEAVVVYASSIQNSLCDFADKLTDVLEKIAIQ